MSHSQLKMARLKLVGIAAAVIALAVVGIGIAQRNLSERELAAAAAEQAPSVLVIHPSPAASSDELLLPAALQALNSTAIHARTNGYVRRWLVDIGDEVRSGQLLVELDAPELDQNLAAARAELETAQADEQLAQSTAERWSEMLTANSVSKQETEEKLGDWAAKKAVTHAARAKVAGLEAQKGFTRIVAPFDGIVTSRSVQIGALVTAGADAPLYNIADISRIRAYVRVPQSYSTQLSKGMDAQLSLPEYPGRTFSATLVRTAGAIDPNSGSLLAEFQAANADRSLKPGAYAQARLALHSTRTAVTLPPSALIVSAQGTQVALLGSDNTATLRNVTIGRDKGTIVEIADGLTTADTVIDNPPDSLQTGDRVALLRTAADTRAK